MRSWEKRTKNLLFGSIVYVCRFSSFLRCIPIKTTHTDDRSFEIIWNASIRTVWHEIAILIMHKLPFQRIYQSAFKIHYMQWFVSNQTKPNQNAISRRQSNELLVRKISNHTQKSVHSKKFNIKTYSLAVSIPAAIFSHSKFDERLKSTAHCPMYTNNEWTQVGDGAWYLMLGER